MNILGPVMRVDVPNLNDISRCLLSDMPDMQNTLKIAGEGVRPAAVLMLLIGPPDGLEIVLTLRAAHLKQHAGQVSFPGGKPDPADQSLRDTALRECVEEIGWPDAGLKKGADDAQIDILGYLAPHQTGTGFLVQPVVGYSDIDPKAFLARAQLQESEVASVWSEPLSGYLDETRYVMESREMLNGKFRDFYMIAGSEPVIWGATARMMLSFVQLLKTGYKKTGYNKAGDIKGSGDAPIHC